VVEKDGQVLNIDSRPSDALAVAVRAHVPILVARSVMDSAGIIPEEDLQEEAAGTDQPAVETEASEEGDERLSVFQDFLEKLDLDNEDEGDEAKDK
jgi:uncharacterized protein